LYQNTPNPFNKSTTIKYQLPAKTKDAKIIIYDLQGKQLKRYPLKADEGEVKVSDLPAGIYLYTLIVDNMPIDTKRMILTE
ncbi:MAG: T9SS type A sorting domain-containing protein, partial [Bacteroidales bacterium]|nr:T9SS type A sorting domain-containing protein [Bacteroidales bacterium]